jgi:hypothetical protein
MKPLASPFRAIAVFLLAASLALAAPHETNIFLADWVE